MRMAPKLLRSYLALLVIFMTVSLKGAAKVPFSVSGSKGGPAPRLLAGQTRLSSILSDPLVGLVMIEWGWSTFSILKLT